MIVDFLGVSTEQSLMTLLGFAMLLGAVMLVLSRILRWTDRASTGRRPGLIPVAIRISPRLRHGSRDAAGYPSDMPSRAPPTLLRSVRQHPPGGHRSRE